MPENQNTAVEMDDRAKDDQGSEALAEEKRSGTRDRRIAKTDRRNPERLAEEIAPRRHPDVKGRRDYDR
ncbi:MAG: hypothetical protein PVH91_05785 [Pseudomonadales bacterium]